MSDVLIFLLVIIAAGALYGGLLLVFQIFDKVRDKLRRRRNQRMESRY